VGGLTASASNSFVASREFVQAHVLIAVLRLIPPVVFFRFIVFSSCVLSALRSAVVSGSSVDHVN